MEERIKVVWICSVSNSKIRGHLELYLPLWQKVLRFLLRRPLNESVADSAQWNTNALNVFERNNDVDLHVIFVHSQMRHKIQTFKENGISYYAVSEDDDSFLSFFRRHFIKGSLPYEKVWKRIVSLVEEINPSIIHMMGAENPQYSLSLLQIPSSIPTIVQLQTLLHNPAVLKAYPNLHPEYEKPVINRASYIGTSISIFPEIIRTFIKENPVIINTQLLVAEDPDLSPCEKEYDFVYFSNYLSKAIDMAIDAFGIACKKKRITLDIIGAASESEMAVLMRRIEAIGIKDFVKFEGRLQTHNDVIRQIKKAKYALLPLKSDLVPGTIREAMSVGLPIVTNETQGTPILNEKRLSVLLSPIADVEAMSANMLKLVNDEDLANMLRANAVITLKEIYGSNASKAQEWVEAYRACINNFNNNTPLPDSILNKN